MSLVSTFVIADDGYFYDDPHIGEPGNPDWFICFDDDDPPELVIFDRRGCPATSRRATLRDARELLQNRGLDACFYVESIAGHCGRCRPTKSMKTADAQAFWLDWKGVPLPVAAIVRHDKRVSGLQTIHEGVVYGKREAKDEKRKEPHHAP